MNLQIALSDHLFVRYDSLADYVSTASRSTCLFLILNFFLDGTHKILSLIDFLLELNYLFVLGTD